MNMKTTRNMNMKTTRNMNMKTTRNMNMKTTREFMGIDAEDGSGELLRIYMTKS
jgi:hypothetical protein